MMHFKFNNYHEEAHTGPKTKGLVHDGGRGDKEAQLLCVNAAALVCQCRWSGLHALCNFRPADIVANSLDHSLDLSLN